MGKWSRRFVFAFQFLTRIPIKTNLELVSEDFSRSSRFFPFVSIVTGLFSALLGAAGYLLVNATFGIALALLGEVFITGALHLDGMGDTMDALGSSRSRERMLEIMKDSRMGTMGVVAIVFDLGLKYILLSAVLGAFGPYFAIAGLICMQMAGRVCVSAGGFVSKSARKDGMGKPFIDGMNGTDLVIVLLIACALMAVLIGVFDSSRFESGIFAGFIAMLLTVPFGMLVARLIGLVFEGITGDTLGFLYEIGEMFFLLVFFRFMVMA